MRRLEGERAEDRSRRSDVRKQNMGKKVGRKEGKKGRELESERDVR